MSIEEIILREDLFARRALDHNFWDSERLMEEVGIKQPEFRTFEEARPIKVIRWNEDRKVFYVEGWPEEWESIKEAYREVEAGREYDADFDKDSVLKSGQVTDSGFSLRTESSLGKGFTTLLMGPVNSRGLETHEYWGFLCTAREWLRYKDDFLISFHFINHHPALWTRPEPERLPNRWSTSEGVSKLWVHASTRDDGSTVIMMEAGAAVPPTRKHTYHDMRLDTYEDTYEKGIIKTAALIHKFFDLDGSEREGVDYEKSELEKTLDERMAAVEEALDKRDSIE